MSIFPPGSITAGIFLIFSILSGAWLTRTGRPLNVVIMTVHKLISLGAVLFTCLAIYLVAQARVINLADWINILVTGILFLTLFASGAVLSGGKVVKGALLVAHRSFPFLAAICFIVLFYYIAIGK
jgi:hypothetical protein